MKRIIVLLLTVSMIAAAFIGCSDKPVKLPSDGFGLTSEDTNGNWLRDDVELEIMKCSVGKKVNPEKTRIRYFGTFDNAVIVSITILDNSISTGEIQYVTIAGFEFSFVEPYWVWTENRLYRLEEAYELGIFTENDIKHIHQRYTMQEHFYGPYNGLIVWQYPINTAPDIVYYENVAGFEFQFSSNYDTVVFNDKVTYGIKEAYEIDALTYDDVKAFYSDYSNHCYIDRLEVYKQYEMWEKS
jgi:hypothetical protein